MPERLRRRTERGRRTESGHWLHLYTEEGRPGLREDRSPGLEWSATSSTTRAGSRRDRTAETSSLWGRFRQRKLVQWLVAYAAVAFVGLQGVDALGEIWGWSLALQRLLTVALGLGLLPAAVVAWFHGERGPQRICVAEVALVGAALASSILLARFVLS